MKKSVLTLGILGILFLGSVSTTILYNPQISFAQAKGSGVPTDGGSGGAGVPTGSDTASKSFNLSFKIDNPIKANNLQELIERLLKLVYLVGVPILVCFLLWAGFKFITAHGDPTKLTKARANLLNVVIGAVLFLGAFTISKVVVSTLKDIFN